MDYEDRATYRATEAAIKRHIRRLEDEERGNPLADNDEEIEAAEDALEQFYDDHC